MTNLQFGAALLGILTCAVGASVGRRLVCLRVWMAVSSACGLVSMLLWCRSAHNQYVDNSWVLLNVLILLPYVSTLCMDSIKPIVYALIGACAWGFFVHCINSGITAYAPALRVTVSMALAVSCATAALSGRERVLLITLCAACMVDAVLYSFSLEWFRFNPPHGWWAYRNILWCGVYLAMGYTVRRR